MLSVCHFAHIEYIHNSMCTQDISWNCVPSESDAPWVHQTLPAFRSVLKGWMEEQAKEVIGISDLLNQFLTLPPPEQVFKVDSINL